MGEGREKSHLCDRKRKGREKTPGGYSKNRQMERRGRIKGTEGEEARRKGRKKGSCRRDQTGGAGAENG